MENSDLNCIRLVQNGLNKAAFLARETSFVPLLLLRLLLAVAFISAGLSKLDGFANTVAWFGNDDWGLGLPFPYLMAILATWTEILGGLLLLLGFATRLAAIPLGVTMLVAIFAVHLPYGWFAIAPSNPENSQAKIAAMVGFPGAQESLENSLEVGARLARAKGILKSHGNYNWLTEKGSFVVLNNGVEFAVIYLSMLLVLLYFGPGRYLSIDYWFARFWHKRVFESA